MNIRNIGNVDLATCFINICQSVSDHTGTDGLNWFSAIGPDLSGVPCGLSMLRQLFSNMYNSAMVAFNPEPMASAALTIGCHFACDSLWSLVTRKWYGGLMFCAKEYTMGWKTSPQRYHVMRLVGETSWQESDQSDNFGRAVEVP